MCACIIAGFGVVTCGITCVGAGGIVRCSIEAISVLCRVASSSTGCLSIAFAAGETEDMENVDLYMQGLGVPARRNVNDPTVIRGEQNFYRAKCHLCHTVTLHTRPRGSVLLNNTQLPWLGRQTIHPYSDFLLHDMGSEIMGVGLNDNYVSGLARGNEWRTTPLWGIGLQEKVNCACTNETFFL